MKSIYKKALLEQGERLRKATLIADIKVPRDSWEQHFAFMQYNMVGMRQLFGRRIEVKYADA